MFIRSKKYSFFFLHVDIQTRRFEAIIGYLLPSKNKYIFYYFFYILILLKIRFNVISFSVYSFNVYISVFFFQVLIPNLSKIYLKTALSR